MNQEVAKNHGRKQSSDRFSLSEIELLLSSNHKFCLDSKMDFHNLMNEFRKAHKLSQLFCNECSSKECLCER